VNAISTGDEMKQSASPIELSGSFGTTKELVQILRWLGLLHYSGRLSISGDTCTSALFVERGHLVASWFGPEQGLAALQATMLAVPSGRFELDRELAGERNIDLQLSQIEAELDGFMNERRELLGDVPMLAAVVRRADLDSEIHTTTSPLLLTRLTIDLLLAADGTRTVGQLIGGQGVARAFHALYLLHGLGLISVLDPRPTMVAEKAGARRGLGFEVGAREWLIVDLAVMLLGEVGLVSSGAQFGFGVSAVLLMVLLWQSSFGSAATRAVFLASTLIPITRLVSLTTPWSAPVGPSSYWLAGLPVAVAAVVTARTLNLSRDQLGLRWGRVPTQLAIALLGIPLAAAQFTLLRPPAFADQLSWGAAVFPCAMLFMAGAIEEFAFRSVLRAAAYERFGQWGLVYASALAASLQVSWLSVPNVLLVFAAGSGSAWLVTRTRSVLGVVLAHGLASAIAHVLLPLLLARPGVAG